MEPEELQAAVQDYISKHGIEALKACLTTYSNNNNNTLLTPSNKLDPLDLIHPNQQRISPSYGKIQTELEVGGDAEAALRTANIQVTSTDISKEFETVAKVKKNIPRKGDLVRAALERRLGRSLEEVRRLVEQQKKARSLEEKERTGIQAEKKELSTSSSLNTTHVNPTKFILPPSKPKISPPFIDPPGFSLIKTIGLFFSVTPTQITLLEGFVSENIKIYVGVGVFETLNLLKEVSKSPEFIIAVTRSNESISFSILSNSSQTNNNVETLTQSYVIEDIVISVKSKVDSPIICISDYAWCLLKRIMSVIDKDGEWRIGHANAAATLRILYSNTANRE